MSFESIRDLYRSSSSKNTEEKPQQRRQLKPTKVDISIPEEVSTIILRNCSTNAVMEDLRKALGYGDSVLKSGRYIVIDKNDIENLKTFASGGFFVKQSQLGPTMVLDLMVDNSNRHHGGRRGEEED